VDMVDTVDMLDINRQGAQHCRRAPCLSFYNSLDDTYPVYTYLTGCLSTHTLTAGSLSARTLSTPAHLN
jgi:hypothetical protein